MSMYIYIYVQKRFDKTTDKGLDQDNCQNTAIRETRCGKERCGKSHSQRQCDETSKREKGDRNDG